MTDACVSRLGNFSYFFYGNFFVDFILFSSGPGFFLRTGPVHGGTGFFRTGKFPATSPIVLLLREFFSCSAIRYAPGPVSRPGLDQPPLSPGPLLGEVDFPRRKNTLGKTGTTEPVKYPVVPLFPHPPKTRGHNSQKHRNRAGIIDGSPAGMREVIFSDVTGIRGRKGRGFGSGWNQAGCWCGSPGTFSRCRKKKISQHGMAEPGTYFRTSTCAPLFAIRSAIARISWAICSST